MNSDAVAAIEAVADGEIVRLLPTTWRAGLAAWVPDQADAADFERLAASVRRVADAPRREPGALLDAATRAAVVSRIRDLEAATERVSLYIVDGRADDAALELVVAICTAAADAYYATDDIGAADGLAAWLAATERCTQGVAALVADETTAPTGARRARAVVVEKRVYKSRHVTFAGWLLLIMVTLKVIRHLYNTPIWLGYGQFTFPMPVNLPALSAGYNDVAVVASDKTPTWWQWVFGYVQDHTVYQNLYFRIDERLEKMFWYYTGRLFAVSPLAGFVALGAIALLVANYSVRTKREKVTVVLRSEDDDGDDDDDDE